MATPQIDGVGETKENVHSKIDRDHNVSRAVEIQIVLRTMHGDCQSCYRAQKTQDIPNFRSAVAMDHCIGCNGAGGLRNAVHLEL
ncbi:unnamed protein product [Pseudo-nitzschia multistriata]|uniref:Uncharacterized protein n=1 Tax=Pseudo-nitzschia multistriata TaxID=183589 RepID=A0A448ZK00_9STRA|nr:unnamed protein product [Pseudo-nitzschia multistriata]